MDILPKELQLLSSSLSEHFENLASGSAEIRDSAINASSYLFDLAIKHEIQSRSSISELLNSMSTTHARQTRSRTRLQENAGSSEQISLLAMLRPTQIEKLFVDGMSDDQIWTQLDLKARNTCLTLNRVFADQDMPMDEESGDSALSISDLDDDMEIDDENEKLSDESEESLQDTFKDISVGVTKSSSRKTHEVADYDESNLYDGIPEADSEDGSEDSIDLFADVNDHIKVSEKGDGGEAFYDDFFDQPSSRSGKPASKNMGGENGHLSKVRFNENISTQTLTPSEQDEEDAELSLDEDEGHFSDSSEEQSRDDGSIVGLDYERLEDKTIRRLKNDIFADDTEDNLDVSAHEQRQAALREQISLLEAENVAQKDWMLMGEASARSRTKNTLLEEDLEFDQVMKLVPVSTQTSVEDLEKLIKSRILNNEYDDVVRRRELDDRTRMASKSEALSDAKSKMSLAQLYEEDYTNTLDANVAGGDQNSTILKVQQEIESHWENICYKLDALCNVHFIPKAPKITVAALPSAPAISFESALPSAQSTSNMQAPEEIFTASTEDYKVRSELAPGEKKALRNKIKNARRRKSRGTNGEPRKVRRNESGHLGVVKRTKKV